MQNVYPGESPIVSCDAQAKVIVVTKINSKKHNTCFPHQLIMDQEENDKDETFLRSHLNHGTYVQVWVGPLIRSVKDDS